MAIDARYQDNVVLKQDAFQNLLTNIKNYPVIDVDYITEMEEDELHGEPIWATYTKGIPCIKITYGDDRTTKGNVIWNEDLKKQISDKKKHINELQTVINELYKRKSRWEEVYNENYVVYEDKDNQVKRFMANFDQIEGNKVAFLTAGWNLLFLDSDLNIDDPYKVVPEGSTFDEHTIYYTRSNLYFFDRYHYTISENNTIDVYENYTYCAASVKNDILADWQAKVVAQEIYTKKVTEDQGPVLYQNLGPEIFKYENILLEKNPYNLVYEGDDYDSGEEYWVRNSAIGTFSLYDHNGMTPDTNVYNTYISDWEDKVAAHSIYTHDVISESNPAKTFNLQYTSLSSRRTDLITELTLDKNMVDPTTGQSIWDQEKDQESVFQHFIDFIRAYNKLVFLDTIGIAGYDVHDIENLRNRALANATPANTALQNIINYLSAEEDLVEGDSHYNLNDFNWEAVDGRWRSELEGYYGTFKNKIADIVTIINNKINTNLIYIRKQIRNVNYSLVEYNEMIKDDEEFIEQAWEQLNNVSAVTYEKVSDVVADTSVWDPNQEYYVLNGTKYERYTPSSATWNNGNGKYLKYDRTTYGYKYIKVGDNVKFIHTYVRTDGNCRTRNGDVDLEIAEANSLSASSQESGTFRITINGHVYEIPIKGLSENAPSNKNIYIKTWHTYNETTKEHSFGNIDFQGNLLGSGNIVTNNGHIFASGGAVAAATYQALRGYAESTGTTTFGPSNSAGLWYDGSSNKLIRTWNISEDKDNVGLGAYQYVFTNNGSTKTTAISGGLSYNTDTIEFHTGLPSVGQSNENNWANIKANNISALGDLTIQGSIVGNLTIEGDLTENGDTTLNGNLTVGSQNSLKTVTINGRTLKISAIPDTNGTTAQFWRGGDTPAWSNTLTGNMTINGNLTVSAGNNGNSPGSVIIFADDGDMADLQDGYCSMRFLSGVRIYNGNKQGSVAITLGSNGDISPTGKVYRAVFNDYAECRPTIDLSPGHIVIDQDDGTLACTTKRLQPGAQVISDTYGDLMGRTEQCQTPIAVAGRVLVYTYQDRHNYHAGMAVCSAPDGTVDIMTREEIRDYSDCIVGIVSEIPEYEYWGTDNVKVNNRIWIKVK